METQKETTELCRKRAVMGMLAWGGRRLNKDNSKGYGR